MLGILLLKIPHREVTIKYTHIYSMFVVVGHKTLGNCFLYLL